MANIYEILSMNPEQRRSLYSADKIGEVEIDGNIFTDYAAFSFAYLKSYQEEPKRSESGIIDNLNSYISFLTPQLKIDFGLLSIDSYRRLIKLIHSKNEFSVTCYDVENNTRVTHNMYFSPEELPTLHTISKALNGDSWVELIGVKNYSIEMTGTNTEVKTVDINYQMNIPQNANWSGSTSFLERVPINVSTHIGSNVSFGDDNIPVSQITLPTTAGKTYRFKYWQDISGFVYVNDMAYFVRDSVTLYAIWEESGA